MSNVPDASSGQPEEAVPEAPVPDEPVVTPEPAAAADADIAPMALFLCSPGASRITGQIISINGGLNA